MLTLLCYSSPWCSNFGPRAVETVLREQAIAVQRGLLALLSASLFHTLLRPLHVHRTPFGRCVGCLCAPHQATLALCFAPLRVLPPVGEARAGKFSPARPVRSGRVCRSFWGGGSEGKGIAAKEAKVTPRCAGFGNGEALRNVVRPHNVPQGEPPSGTCAGRGPKTGTEPNSKFDQHNR